MNANMILTDSERENARENKGFIPIEPKEMYYRVVGSTYIISSTHNIDAYRQARTNGNIEMACFYAYLTTRYCVNDSTIEHMNFYQDFPIKRTTF